MSPERARWCFSMRLLVVRPIAHEPTPTAPDLLFVVFVAEQHGYTQLDRVERLRADDVT